MPRLQCDDGCGAFFSAAPAAYAFSIIDTGVQAFVYPDGPHGTDFLAAAAGYTFFLIHYSMSFWQMKHLNQIKNRETVPKDEAGLPFFIMQYFAVICKEVPVLIFVRIFLFSGGYDIIITKTDIVYTGLIAR